MIDLKQNTLLREMPDNLLKDEKVMNLCLSLQKSLNKMLDWSEKINYTTNIDLLDDEILEHLLWEKHISWKEGVGLATTRQQKINLIKNAVELHRIKGTPAAIELVFQLVNVDCKLEEWFEYGGNPYHFKLKLRITDKGLTEETIKILEMMVMEYKNVRSYLESLNIYYSSTNNIHVGTATLTSEKITIYPYTPSHINSKVSAKNAVATHNTFERISVYPKEAR